MECSYLRTWDKYGTIDANPGRFNLSLLYNVTIEDCYFLQQLLQDKIVAFHPKAQVCKSKLETCPEPSKVVFILYSAPNFQISYLVNNFLGVIKDKKRFDIEITTQLQPDLYTEYKRKSFYTSYNREDEQEKIKFNHLKIRTGYCLTKYRNLLDIHLLRASSSKHQAKYPTARCQQRFSHPQGRAWCINLIVRSRIIPLTLEYCP